MSDKTDSSNNLIFRLNSQIREKMRIYSRQKITIAITIVIAIVICICLSISPRSNLAIHKIRTFEQSGSSTIKPADIFPGKWDRLCVVQDSLSSEGLGEKLGRRLGLGETMYWYFVMFTEMESGSILILESGKSIASIQAIGSVGASFVCANKAEAILTKKRNAAFFSVKKEGM